MDVSLWLRSGLGRLAGLGMQAAVLGALLFGAAACGDEEVHVAAYVDSTDTRSKDILQLIQEADSLDRFLDAIRKTGLAEDLSGYGPWTVFAPSDRAFGRSQGWLDTLYAGSLTDSLAQVMQYHVVRGRIVPSEIEDSLRIATLYNKPIVLQRGSNVLLMVNGARNRARAWTQVEAQNGTLYVMNNVLILPLPDTTVSAEILFGGS